MDVVGQTSGIGDAPWWSGAGYGFGGGRFADFGSNAVRLDRNGQYIENQADCTRSVLGLGLDNISNNFENQTRAAEFTRVCTAINNSEFRNIDRLRDQDREIAANARAAAQCCCDLKLQSCEDKAELKAEILAVEARGIQRDLDTANRQLSERNIIDAVSFRCGCCPPGGSNGSGS